MPDKNKLGKFWNEKARTQMLSGIVVALLALTAVTGFFVALSGVSAGSITDFRYNKDVHVYNANDSIVNVTVTKNISKVNGVTSYWEQIQNAPSSTHTFQPVRDVGIHVYEFNITIDSQTWKYLAYDSDQNGNEIRLYMSNDMTHWTPYSSNPIMSGTDLYRWPSTIYYGGTFYMFVNERANSDVVIYTGTDAIHYTKGDTVLTGWPTNNPYIYLNPNDNKFYLYYHPASGAITVKVADTIDGLASATNTQFLSEAAAPSVMFYDGYYYLFTERGSYVDGWYVDCYRSTNPTSGFSEYAIIVPASGDEACPIPATDGTYYYLFTNHHYSSSYPDWSAYERYITFTLNYNGTKSDFSDIAFFDISDNQLPYNQTAYNTTEAHFLVNVTGTDGNITYAWDSDTYIPQYTNFSTSSSNFSFTDDFESGNLSKWDYVGSAWSVQTSGTNHYAYGDVSSDWQEVYLKKTVDTNGTITVESDVNPQADSGSTKVSIKGSMSDESTLYLVEFKTDGSVTHYSGSHDAWPENASFTSGQWVHVKLIIDTINSTVQLWLGSNYCGEITLQDGSGNTKTGIFHDVWFANTNVDGNAFSIDNVTISSSAGSITGVTYADAEMITPFFFINTSPVNHAPTIILNSPGNGSTGVDVNASISVTVSDPDGDNMTITFWNWSGSEWIAWGQLTNKGNGTYSFNPPGDFAYNTTYTWRASASDGNATSNSETWTFTTAPQNTTPNQPPTAAFTYSTNDLTVTFTDGSTDSDGTIASWNWSFGDGQYSTAQNPQHTYSSYGTYSVNLTVTDNDGATDTISESITLATGGGDTVSSDINTWYLIIGIMAFAIVAMMMVVFAGKRR